MIYDENTSKVKGVNTNQDCLRARRVRSSSIHDDYEYDLRRRLGSKRTLGGWHFIFLLALSLYVTMGYNLR